MLQTILMWTEATFTFTFLILALAFTYPFKKGRFPSYIVTIFWIVLFTAVYKPLEIYTGSFYVYLGIVFIFAFLFTFLFQKQTLSAKTAFIITYICSIVFIKSSLLPLLTVPRQNLDGELTAAGHLVLYIGLAVCTLFFVLHPLVFQPQLPRKYSILMMLSPFVVAVFAQLYIYPLPEKAPRIYFSL